MSSVHIPTAADGRRGVILWLIIFCSILAWSAIRPHDYFTWFMEVLPALSAVSVMAATYRSFRLTSFCTG